MKTNSEKTNNKIWFGAAIGLALMLLATCPQGAVAQSNTFPSSGNVGIGTTSPTSALTLANSSTVTIQTGQAHSTMLSAANLTMINVASTTLGASLLFQGNRANSGYTGTTFARIRAGKENSIDDNGNGAITFDTTNNSAPNTLIERMRIDGTGNVGIGTTTPQTIFNVSQTAGGSKGLLISGDEYYQTGNGSATTGILLLLGVNRTGNRQLWLGDRDSLGSPTNGFFRIQSGQFNSMDAVSGNGVTRLPLNLGTATSNVGVGFNDFTSTPGAKLSVAGNLSVGNGYKAAAAPSNGMVIEGNVGIGTTSPDPAYRLDIVGSARVSGTINAKYQDVAEWVESSQSLPSGTVVVLDHTKSNQVVASSQAYDTRVAGVISTLPGIALGERGETKVLVATTGRVKIKVDATRAPIQVGDLLVTGDREGFAMKSLPVNIGGVQLHRPGTLVGKALEPLAKGTGEILVLLSLQ